MEKLGLAFAFFKHFGIECLLLNLLMSTIILVGFSLIQQKLRSENNNWILKHITGKLRAA